MFLSSAQMGIIQQRPEWFMRLASAKNARFLSTRRTPRRAGGRGREPDTWRLQMPIAGDPVTKADVSSSNDPEYQGKPITSLILAELAMDRKNRLIGGSNPVDAEQFATDAIRQESRANGNMTATLILIYNATGGDINFVAAKDWSGHLGRSGFDPLIRNGQWCYILHTHVGNTWAGSVGCCVYRGEEADFFMGWSNPYGGATTGNGVYVESREQGHWPDLEKMYDLVNEAGSSSTDPTRPYEMLASIGTGATPICKIILRRTE